jgi:hypothetical protein
MRAASLPEHPLDNHERQMKESLPEHPHDNHEHQMKESNADSLETNKVSYFFHHSTIRCLNMPYHDVLY